MSCFVNGDIQEQLDGHLVDTLGVATAAARRCPALRLLLSTRAAAAATETPIPKSASPAGSRS